MPHIINDPVKQLIIPGFRPYFEKYFRHCFCGNFTGQDSARDNYSLGCAKPAAVKAVWFVMGNYNEDDDEPELVGFDCPFDDSEQLCACSSSHLENMLTQISSGFFGADHGLCGKAPDIITDANGRIEKEIYLKIMRNVYDTALTSDFSKEKSWSFGRESLEQLWQREKWRFIT